MSKNVSKKISDLLLEANAKQKALLICTQWIGRDNEGVKGLTEDEAKVVKSSLKSYEVEEYNYWIDIYRYYREATPTFGLIYKDYQANAEKVLGLLRLWDNYVGEENRLNTIYHSIKGKADAEALLHTIKKLPYSFAKVEIKDGYISLNTELLYEIILSNINRLTEAYADAKAVVQITENYARRTKSTAFVPYPIREAMKAIKADYALAVSSRFSRKVLLKRISKGESVTEAEKRRAVFPCYDEVEVTAEKMEYFRSILRYGKK